MVLVSLTFVSAAAKPIYTCEELQNISFDLTRYYELANDIDCSDTVNWNGGLGFEPLGSEDITFEGGLIASEIYTISNLYINRPDTDYVGLLGYFTGPTMHHIKLENAIIIGNNYVGMIGFSGGGFIVNNTFEGIVSGNENVGGLLGYVEGGLETGDVVENIVSADVYYLGDYYGLLYGGTSGLYEFNNTVSGNLICGIYDTTPPTFTTIPENVVITEGDLFWGVDFDAIDDDYVYFSVNDTENFQIDQNEGQLGDTHTLGVGFYPVNVTITDPTGNLDWTIWSLTIEANIPPVTQPSGSSAGLKMEQLPTGEQAPVSKISIFSSIGNFFQNILNWFKNLFN